MDYYYYNNSININNNYLNQSYNCTLKSTCSFLLDGNEIKRISNVNKLMTESFYLLNRIQSINEIQTKKHKIFYPQRTLNESLFFSSKILYQSLYSSFNLSNSNTYKLKYVFFFCK